jgi:hypothetical protein
LRSREATPKQWMISMRLPPLLASAVLVSACYTYQPLANADPTRGQPVQIQLAPQASERLVRIYGPNIWQLDGTVAAVESDTLRVLVDVARTPAGIESYFKNDPVSLARGEIESMSRRKLAVGSTILLGGAVVGGLIGTSAALTGGSESGQPPATPGNGTQPE